MSPVKCISGIIRFDTPLIDSPEEEEQKPGNCKPVIEYLSRYKLGYAIPNRKVTEITPVSLASLQSKYNFTPPQAFLYLKNNRPLFDFLVIQSNLETLRACLKKKKVVRTVDVYVYSLEQLILNQ